MIPWTEQYDSTMKKTLLPIALLLAPPLAQADWIEISTGDSIGDVSVYIDSAAIRSNRSLAHLSQPAG